MRRRGHETFPAAPPASRPDESGFSMVEMLLVLAALSILFGAIYSGFERLNRSYTAENVKAAAQQSARIGVEMMVQDIRLAGLDPLGTAGAGIVEATPTRLQYTADVNYDGLLDGDFENIAYALNGNRLEQTSHLGTEVLLDHVSQLQFSYFDAAGVPIPEADLAARRLDIRAIEITLTIQRPAGSHPEISRTYTTRVRCRNL
ncbi:MAG: prepilin-type N-terminal cleavage/methylation domain-containing protein [Desulfobacterales bacterium]